MGLVSTWLEGCGLGYCIKQFQEAGIVTPVALSELELSHYELLGVKSAEDRRKLFYLVSRIRLAVRKDQRKDISSSSATVTLEDQVAAVVSLTSLEMDNDDDKQSNGESTQQQMMHQGTEVSRAGVPTKIPIQVSMNAPSSSSTDINPFGFKTSEGRTKTSPGEKTTPKKDTPIDQHSDVNDLLDELLDDESNSSDEDGLDENTNNEAADDKASASNFKADDIADSTTYRRSNRIAAKKQGPDWGKTTCTPSSKITRNNKSNKVSKRHIPPNKFAAKNEPDSFDESGECKTPEKQKAISTTVSKRQTQPSTRTGMPIPRARSRPESKLQNPSKSLRTGKQLSTIPADSIAPMSPLVDLKTAQLDLGGVEDDEVATSQKVAGSNTRRKSGLVSKSGAGSRSRSTGVRRGNISDSSDSESLSSQVFAARNRQKSFGAARSRTNSGRGNDSDSSSTKRRRSMIHAPAARPLAHHRASSVVTKHKTGTDAAAKRRSLSATANRRASSGGNAAAVKASFKTQISNLREKFSAEHELFQADDFCGEDANFENFLNEEKIMVVVRKRPFSASKENDMDIIQPLDYGNYGIVNVHQPKTRVDLTKHVETIPFAFDAVYDETHSNKSLYSKSVQGLIPVCLHGSCATVFAYGQTGSGKTHTVLGKDGDDSENMGLYRMAAADIFAAIDHPDYNSLTVSVSLFEIYGGKLYDLFNNRTPVKCLENYDGEMVFPGLSRHDISRPEELMEWIDFGSKARSVGSTSRNADSSRSHAVLQLHIRKATEAREDVDYGKLVFIDLAGNERANDVGHCSRATRLEGAEINTSLLALKEVIRARATNGSMVHVPFRGSRLTQVLKESFVGENSRCLMIACIAPDMDNCEQTLNTLRYADRMKERNSKTGKLPASSSPQRGGRRRSSVLPPGSFSNFMSIVSPKEHDYWVDVEDDRPTLAPSKPQDGMESKHGRQDSESALDKQLVTELLETHQSFVTAVLGMVEDEILLVDELRADGSNWAEIVHLLAANQENQKSLISDLRECFQLESIHETILDSQLNAQKSILVALLDIVQEESAFITNVAELAVEVTAQLESIQQRKLAQISELRDCFEAPGTSTGASTAELIFSESFKSENDEQVHSDEDSFEDLRD